MQPGSIMMKLIHERALAKYYLGDARNMNLIEDESIQLIVTSPPYANARSYSSWEGYDEYLADMLLAWKECHRVLCNGGRIAINVVHGYGRPGSPDGYFPLGHRVTDQLENIGFELRGVIIWNKTHSILGTAWGSWLSASNPSLRDQHEFIIVGHKGDAKRAKGEDTIDSDTFIKATSSIWYFPPKTRKWHPAPFPAELPKRLIELYSFIGDSVLDPFAGSFTTVHVAEGLKRKGIGIDIHEEYVRQSVGPLFLA